MHLSMLRWLTAGLSAAFLAGVLPQRKIGLIWVARGLKQGLMDRNRRLAMPASVSTTTVTWPVLLVALVGGLVFAAAIGLWTYYGTTIFFEMVRTGWMACF